MNHLLADISLEISSCIWFSLKTTKFLKSRLLQVLGSTPKGLILHAFLLSAEFLKLLLSENLSGTSSKCQTDWIQIRHDILSCLIWVQTVCKDHQQTEKCHQQVKSLCHTKVSNYLIRMIFSQLYFKFVTFKLMGSRDHV